jgi:predicted transposase YbfD/YdcC
MKPPLGFIRNTQIRDGQSSQILEIGTARMPASLCRKSGILIRHGLSLILRPGNRHLPSGAATPEKQTENDFTARWIWENVIFSGETVTEIKGEIRRETRYYLSSLPLGVETFAKAVRSHWGVENQCHWVLDVIYREDESRARTGHNAENLCTTRALALNLTRLETTNKRGIKARVKRAGWEAGF